MTKELRVRVAANQGSMHEIYYEGGGQVPESLSGLYNKVTYALHAISQYKPVKRTKKDSKDGQKIG
ncbi:MAG: hypothetical protein JKY81_02305 [Colwellia sp.]|nr:hypothetical protein [Colwellia sp.]